MDRRWMYDRCYDGGQIKEVFKFGVELFIDALNTDLDESDETFFNDLQHDSLLQTMMEEDFEIPGFTNASHDPAAWNQGGENPF
ncbi:hypothetical protein A2U01_0064407, partial [Trifolium medium]|nr:hypothetical protein [Trifolium medium]